MKKHIPPIFSSLKAKLPFITTIIFTVFIVACLSHIIINCTKPLAGQSLDLSIDNGDDHGWSVYVIEQGKTRELTQVNGVEYTGLSHTGQTYYTSRVMTEQLEEPFLSISLIDKPGSIFLDDRLLYTDAPEADNRLGHLELSDVSIRRQHRVRISLPPDYHGKILTIAQCDPGGEKPGYDTVTPAQVLLQTEAGQGSEQIAATTKEILPVLLLTVITLVLLGIFLFQTYRRQPDYGVLFLTLYSLFWALFELADTSIAYNYSNMPWNASYNLFRYGGITFLLLFLRTRMETKRCRQIMVPVILLQAVAIVISKLGENAVIPVFHTYYNVYYTNAFVSFLALLLSMVLIIPESRNGTPFYRRLMKFLILSPAFILLWVLLLQIQASDAYASLIYRLRHPTPLTICILLTSMFRVFLLTGATFLVIYEYILKLINQNAALRLLEQKNRLSMESYKNLERYMENVRFIKHDVKKHYAIIFSLLQNNDAPQALSYVENLLEDTGQLSAVADTENYMVNTIINSKVSLFQRENIQAKIMAGKIPAQLPLSDTELCSLLLNILDNAVTAVCKMPPEKRFLEITTHTAHGQFYFYCRNSALTFGPQNAPGPDMTVDRDGHGYGLKIIRQIVNKYGGALKIEPMNDAFAISVLIPLPPGDGMAQRQ